MYFTFTYVGPQGVTSRARRKEFEILGAPIRPTRFRLVTNVF